MSNDLREETLSTPLMIDCHELHDVSIDDEDVIELRDSNDILSREHYRAIVALASGAFVVRVNEFILLSFITEISDTYSMPVTITSASIFLLMIGSLISLPSIMSLTAKIERNYLLVILQFLLAVSATISAVAPQFLVLLLGRLFSSFAHAAYMGAAAMEVAQMVPPSQKDQALDLFFLGTALASIIGVPLAVHLGDKTSWHDALWSITFLSLCAALSITLFLPKRDNHESIHDTELAIFRKPALWNALGVSTLAYAGTVTPRSFFSKMMMNLAGYSQKDLAWLTVVYTGGGVVGAVYGNNSFNMHVLKSVTSQLAALAVVLFVLTWAIDYKIPTATVLCARGFTEFAVVTPLMRYTSYKALNNNPKGVDRAPLADTANSFVYEIGSALGLFVNYFAIQQGSEYRSLNAIGGAEVLFALCCIVYAEKKKIAQKFGGCGLFNRSTPRYPSSYDLVETLENPRSVRVSDDASVDGGSEYAPSNRSSFSNNLFGGSSIQSVFSLRHAVQGPPDEIDEHPGRYSFSSTGAVDNSSF